MTTQTEEYNYIIEPGKTTGKDDPDSDEESFVKLLKKYKGAEKSLKELALWFFESVEDQESICDMEDLLKYLFQKEMGIDLGVEDFDFEEYGKNMMYCGSVIFKGDTVEEKVWNALTSAGFSKYATAGVMGNIKGESGFDPNVVEAGNGIGFGLCQWSFSRRTDYESYAALKGVPPGNLDTQIEFLLGELGCDQYVNEYNKGTRYWRCSAADRGYSNAPDYKTYGCEEWANSKSPEEAAKIFLIWYEGPWTYLPERETWAREYYEKYKGTSLSSSSKKTSDAKYTSNTNLNV